MHAVHFFCPGVPSDAVRAKYEQALAPLSDARIIWHTVQGLSSVFVNLAQSWRDGGGRCIPNLKRETGTTDATTTSLVCFSAGYGAVREMLWHPADRDAVDAVVCIDAVHAGWDSDGSPSDAMLAGFAAYAKLAKHTQQALLWLGHSDVPVADFPHGYASTTDTAAELVRLAGGQGGQFYVQAFNVRPASQPKAEHGAALTEWGAGFMGEALVPHLGRLAAERAGAIPWRDPHLSLGERCVLWSLAQVALGSLETWGHNAGPRIAAYFKGATRRYNGVEKPVGISKGEWCVVALTAAERSARLPHEEPVLHLRVAGWETARDAVEDGLWVSAEDIRAGRYVPRVGDVGIHVRPKTANPDIVLTRHAFRFVTVPNVEGGFTSVDGNSGHDGKRWATNERSIHDAAFLGCVRHPQMAADVMPDVWAEAVKASAEVVLGRDGIHYALAGLLPDPA